MDQKYVIIYLPTKTATQSGVNNTKLWVIEHIQDKTSYKSSLMKWNGSRDTYKQVKLKFPSLEAAIHYAKEHNLKYKILPHAQHTMKKKSYASNFTKFN